MSALHDYIRTVASQAFSRGYAAGEFENTPISQFPDYDDRSVQLAGYMASGFEDDTIDQFLPPVEVEVQRLGDELAESDALRQRLSDLLTLTANALKGEPPKDTLHSWHDLPERADIYRALFGEAAIALAECHGVCGIPLCPACELGGRLLQASRGQNPVGAQEAP